jgi:hypothetical protein
VSHTSESLSHTPYDSTAMLSLGAVCGERVPKGRVHATVLDPDNVIMTKIPRVSLNLIEGALKGLGRGCNSCRC